MYYGLDQSPKGFSIFALRYEHGDKRPIKESLRMKLSGRQKSSLDSDALAEIKNQLTYFYTHSIVDAIKHAFL